MEKLGVGVYKTGNISETVEDRAKVTISAQRTITAIIAVTQVLTMLRIIEQLLIGVSKIRNIGLSPLSYRIFCPSSHSRLTDSQTSR